MGDIIIFMMTSIDGYFEGKNRDLSWHNVDSEFLDFAMAQLKDCDLLLFGHRTYDLMESYWTSKAAEQEDPKTARLMNKAEKIVFSKTLEKAEWNNTHVMREVNQKEIIALKKSHNKKIAILGSSNLALSFISQGLIDEFRIMVNPIILGKGATLFEGIEKELKLRLISKRIFGNGNVLLSYKP